MFPYGGKEHISTKFIPAQLYDKQGNKFYFHDMGYIPSLAQTNCFVHFPSP